MSNTQRLLREATLYCLIGGADALSVARAALEGGVQIIQLREKTQTDRALYELGRALVLLCREAGALLIVNDRPDLARALGADGVHLGQDDLPVAVAREILPPGSLIGVSTHSDAEIEQALAAGADYLGLGCCYPSSTKDVLQMAGLELVSRWSGQLEIPWFPLGGVTLARLDELTARGARSVAVSSAICRAPDPREAAAAFRQRLR